MMRSSVILSCGSVFDVLGRRWKSRHFRGIHYFVFSSLAFFIRGMKWTSFIFSAVTRLGGFEKHRRFPDGKQCQLGGIRHRCRGWYRTGYRCYAPLYEICTHFVVISHSYSTSRSNSSTIDIRPVVSACIDMILCPYPSNISRTLVGHKIVDHSDVVGASPVGAAPTTSSFSTKHLASRDSGKKTARQYDNLLSFVIWCVLY